MPFNRKGFIQAAKSQGIGDEEINNYLISQKVKPLSSPEKILYSKAIPWIGSILGGVAAAPIAPISAGASIPFGSLAGGGAASTIQNLLKDLLGYQEKDPLGQVTEATNQAVTAAFLATLPQIFKTALSPLQTTKNIASKVRTASIGEQTVPTEKAQEDILEKLKSSKYYGAAVPEARHTAEARLAQYLNEVSPLETINPGPGGVSVGTSTVRQNPNVNINRMYEYLPPFEQMGNAYGKNGDVGSTAISQGTNLASRAIREYLNTQIPKSAQVANDIYGTVSNIQQPIQRLIKYSIPTAILYRLISKLSGR